ncbi:MAG: HipA N-terminal domain-containing protein [Acidovorax sp.]|uniref:HipA N-terminal domain-containing protein n=1 Tax=Acidovorax sp. TaxID=1872122 RepID=UPI0039E6D479
MSGRQLHVIINGHPVGTLAEDGNVWGFEYAASWLADSKAYALSPALPLGAGMRRDGGTQRPVQWFFDNLLPEELLCHVIAREEGVEAADAFGLLERLGAESAGALVLQPPGAPAAPTGAQTLAREALSARIRNLPRASLNHGAPKRMSLAGAQHKMVVNFDPEHGHAHARTGSAASTAPSLLTRRCGASCPRLDLHENGLQRLCRKRWKLIFQ